MHCHTQRGTADYIVSRGAHYILTVKENQRNLRKRLKALPWEQVPVLATDLEHGRGRTATRRLEGDRDRSRNRLPARRASSATDPQDPPLTRRADAHRNRLRRVFTVRGRPLRCWVGNKAGQGGVW